MRMPLILACLLTFALGTMASAQDLGPSVPHHSQVTQNDLSALASGKLPLSSAALTYKYNNQWGVEEIWQIQGTTLLYKKSIHTVEAYSIARQTLASGGSLVGMQSNIFDLEYGDYDHYFRGTLTEAQVKSLYQALTSNRLAESPAYVGCGENHWEINMDVSGKLLQIFDVNAPANPVFSANITAVQNLFAAEESNLTSITRDAFMQQYRNLIVNPNVAPGS